MLESIKNFFRRKIVIPHPDHIAIIPVDPSKSYIIVIKEGYVNLEDVRHINLPKAAIVRTR